MLQNYTDNTVLLRAGITRPEQIISPVSLWTPEVDVKSAKIALLPDIDNKRLYREWIELWLQDNSQQELTLWLDGSTAIRIKYFVPHRVIALFVRVVKYFLRA